MTHRLILVKHSLPRLEPGIPANRWELSPTGQQRCIRLAEGLAEYLPFQLFSSMEPKAAQTAALAARQLDIPWRTHPGLHEHERSQVGFRSAEQFQADVRLFFDRPSEVVFGDESADQAHRRFSAAIQALVQAHPHTEGNLVVVAHGTVISLYVSRCRGLPAYPLWEQLGLPSFLVLDLPIELDQHRNGGHPLDIFNPYHPGAPV